MSTQETWHPTEDDLVLLFYGDANPDDERRLAAHVETCADCQPVWREIQGTLAAVDAAGIPEPPADFERVMWARVQREIDGIQPVRVTQWWAPRFWLPAASLAAVVIAVVAVRSLAPHLKEFIPAVTVSVIPRPNQAFWTLSALWAGWL